MAFLLSALAMIATANVAHGDSTVSVVERKMFLTGTPNQPQSLALSFSRPSGSNVTANLTSTELEFVSPLIQTNIVTISTPLILSLWLNSTKDVNLSLVGALHEKLSGGQPLIIVNSTLAVPIRSGLRPNNIELDFQDQQLPVFSSFSVGFRIAPIPKVNVTLFWGSSAAPSAAVMRLSGYESLAATNPLQILGGIPPKPTTTFDQNATYPNNIVFFQASVFSAFGILDIRSVNLTVIDPLSHLVKREQMDLAPSQIQQPYVYTASWPYRPNATSGTYQVNIAIVDSQNLTAFKFNNVATFGIKPNTIFSRALDLIPYFGVGGGAVVAGAVYARQRRTKKSYLVPFDYFNTLTGGELEGGTSVSIEGNTGSGKTLLTEQLMFEDLKRGRPCVFVSTGDFPANIRTSMRGIGLDVSGYEQNGLLNFIDGYSAEAGQQSTEKFSVPSLGDLTTLGVKISSSLPQDSFKGGSLYFDSLTPLASKAKPESLVSFVQSVGARVKGMGGKAFFTLGPSVDGVVQKQLEEMADCVVQMEAFEESGVRKSRLRIAKLRARRHQQGWVIYTIEDGKGIIFYSRKPRR
jgi:KaiC/GvpD/RAD55 family RecA-like ATPase